jgi:hypothetical protein
MKIKRRSVLQGAAGIGASAGVGRALFGCAASDDEAHREPAERPTERRTLHFDLPPGLENIALTLEVGGVDYILRRHDKETLARHRDENAYLRTLPDDQLDAYVEGAVFTADSPQSYFVTYSRPGADPDDSRRGLLLAGIHVPRPGAEEAMGLMPGFQIAPRRFEAALRTQTDQDIDPFDLRVLVNAEDIAEWIIVHHPEIMSLDNATAALVVSVIDTLPEKRALVDTILDIGRRLHPVDSDYEGWAVAKYSQDLDGNPIPILNKDGTPVRGPNGKIQNHFDWEPHPDLREAMGRALCAALAKIRNTPVFENRLYLVPPGFHAVENGVDPASTVRVNAGDAGADAGGLLTAHDALPYALRVKRGGEWRHGQRVVGRPTSGRTLDVIVDNSYFRYLGVWVAFEDADGKLIPLQRLGLEPDPSYGHIYAKYLGMISPPPRVLAMPVDWFVSTDTVQTYRQTLPDGATTMLVMTGTAGFSDGDDRPELAGIPEPGEAMTWTFGVGLPSMLLAIGGGVATQQFMVKVAVKFGALIVQEAIRYGFSVKLRSSGGRERSVQIVTALINFLLKTGIQKLAVELAGLFGVAVAEGVAKKATPIAGWIAWAVDLAAGAASIATTMTDIGLARRYLKTEVSYTHALRVKISPDPKHPGAFPATADQIVITALLGESQSYTDTIDPFDPVTAPPVIEHVFPQIPSGGEVTINVLFLNKKAGWLVGRGTSPKLRNVLSGGETELVLPVPIEEQQVPLLPNTKYYHQRKLAVVDGKHVWQPTTVAPMVLKAQLDCRPGMEALCNVQSISYTTISGQLGYGYGAASTEVAECGTPTKSKQLYLIQSINDLKTLGDGTPDAALEVLACGYTRPVHVVYDLMAPPDGNHFALVPSRVTSGYTLRKIQLQRKDVFAQIESAPIYGRFKSESIGAVRYHSAGFVVATNSTGDKIEILDLPRSAASSELTAARAGEFSAAGEQRGMVRGVVAIACMFTGTTFLVLEAANKRLQAFSRNGNPVARFGKPGAMSAIVSLKAETTPVTYLDLAVEATDYIYVLSYANEGTVVDDYRLDIYQPNGDWLARTTGMVAGRIAVDFWRNVFTLNYEQLVGPNKRTEPSVSGWIPGTI